MALRSSQRYWTTLIMNQIRGGATYATSTSAKITEGGSSVAAANWVRNRPRLPVRGGDKVPLYMAAGMIGLSVTLGLHTAAQQLRRSPSVYVKKGRRETVPEVYEPEAVAEEAEQFINKSLFRKVAHVKLEEHSHDHPRFETLKSVGVDPKATNDS